MQEANEMRDQLIREFTENHMEKLFYFCLKKTGNNTDAEDLTQDIALNILSSLNKGTSVWATEKHKRNEKERTDSRNCPSYSQGTASRKTSL